MSGKKLDILIVEDNQQLREIMLRVDVVTAAGAGGSTTGASFAYKGVEALCSLGPRVTKGLDVV